jgi:cytochrome c peroxidase
MKRMRIWGLAAVAVVACAGVVTHVARNGPQLSGVMNPHGARTPRAEMERLLRATDAVASSTSRAELVARGRTLFRASSVALDGESCQSCHTEGGANGALGTIVHLMSEGDTFDGPRDAPSLFGVKRTPPYRWDGKVMTLEAMVIDTIKNHFKPSDRTDIPGKTAALVAYLEELEPPPSAFDDGTLTASALRGEALFQGKAGCFACHGGPLLTDNRIHDTGVPQIAMAGGKTSNDPGAPAPPPPPGEAQTPGPFINTPQLRDLKNSAPYMHNGSMKTLREVIAFYNTQSPLISPLRLSNAEMDDLVAYLNGL